MVRGSIYNFEFACWGDVNAFYRLWLLSCYFVGQQTILELERRKLFLHRFGKLSPNTSHTIGSARRTRTVRRRLHPLSARIIRCLAQRSNKCKPLHSPLNDSSHWWTGTFQRFNQHCGCIVLPHYGECWSRKYSSYTAATENAAATDRPPSAVICCQCEGFMSSTSAWRPEDFNRYKKINRYNLNTKNQRSIVCATFSF